MKIDINKIFPDPDQPRQHFVKSELEELKKSIESKGIYVPLSVESNYNGDNFLLLDGERRYRSAKELNLKEVPVTVFDGPLTNKERTVIRFHIQEQHKNWSLFDKAKAIYNLKKETGMSIQEIANQLNSNAPTIHYWLSLVDFTPETQKEIVDKKISFTYLIHLSKIVKDYMSICDLERLEIEKKLIAKVKNGVFKTTLELQQFSTLMSSYEKQEEKINFLNEENSDLSRLFEKTTVNNDIILNSLYKSLISLNKNISLYKNNNSSISKECKEMLEATKKNIETILNI